MKLSEAKIGQKVIVTEKEHEGERTIIGFMERIEGGVILDQRVDGIRYWNVDELEEAP